jgi:hypothetical protein
MATSERRPIGVAEYKVESRMARTFISGKKVSIRGRSNS